MKTKVKVKSGQVGHCPLRNDEREAGARSNSGNEDSAVTNIEKGCVENNSMRYGDV